MPLRTERIRSEPRPANDERLTGRTSAVMLVGLGIGNIANYAFQIVSGRFFGVDEYGLLAGLLSAMTVITVSVSAVQTSAAKAIAAGTNDATSHARLDTLTRTTLLFAGVAGLVVVLLSPLLGSLLNVGTIPVLVLGFYIAPAALDSIAAGRFQGLHRFTAMTWYATAQASVKVPLALLVFMAGMRVTTLVAGLAVVTGMIAIAALGMSGEAGAVNTHVFDADVRRAFVALTLFWLIVSSDVPFARARFPDEAGVYAAAAVLGKAVLWLPTVIAHIAFPRITSRAARGESAAPVMLRAMAFSLAISGSAVIVLALLGGPIFSVLYGEDYNGAASLAWRVGLAMVPFAIVNTFVQLHLARRDNAFLGWLAVAALGQFIALATVAKTGTAYAIVLGSTGGFMALALFPRSGYRHLRAGFRGRPEAAVVQLSAD